MSPSSSSPLEARLDALAEKKAHLNDLAATSPELEEAVKEARAYERDLAQLEDEQQGWTTLRYVPQPYPVYPLGSWWVSPWWQANTTAMLPSMPPLSGTITINTAANTAACVPTVTWGDTTTSSIR